MPVLEPEVQAAQRRVIRGQLGQGLWQTVTGAADVITSAIGVVLRSLWILFLLYLLYLIFK